MSNAKKPLRIGVAGVGVVGQGVIKYLAEHPDFAPAAGQVAVTLGGAPKTVTAETVVDGWAGGDGAGAASAWAAVKAARAAKTAVRIRRYWSASGTGKWRLGIRLRGRPEQSVPGAVRWA